MFKDLALMVEQQGAMLNNIEKNINDAWEYVNEAERITSEAKDYTNQVRKVCTFKMVLSYCIAAGCVIQAISYTIVLLPHF